MGRNAVNQQSVSRSLGPLRPCWHGLASEILVLLYQMGFSYWKETVALDVSFTKLGYRWQSGRPPNSFPRKSEFRESENALESVLY